jgi:ring-1,2-phenylacetyl-CoA epoxidase subunit PaaE
VKGKAVEGSAVSDPGSTGTSTVAPARRTHAVFHQLRVQQVERLTDDAVAVTFAIPAELADAFRFLPGQHVTVRTAAAGDDLRRNYSICTPATTDAPRSLRIGVKRVAGGGFSAYALERMRAGDLVDVMTPTGRFCVTPERHRDRHLCCVAAGSGITPLLSIVASVLEGEAGSRITLLYGNRTSASIMFVEELADLKDRFPDRLHLVHVLSREHPEIALYDGRIDGSRMRDFLGLLVPPDTVDGWYLCGPLGMVEELRTVLRDHGVPRTSVHTELFHVGPPPGPVTPVAVAATVDDGCEVTAIMDGRRSSFRLPKAGPPVLEGVLGVRSDAPFACRGGVCGTCRAKVLEGAVTMDRCYALESDEVERGFVLTCQSHPTTDRLTVDYDA